MKFLRTQLRIFEADIFIYFTHFCTAVTLFVSLLHLYKQTYQTLAFLNVRIWFFSLSFESKFRVFGCLLDHVSCLKTSHRLWVIVVTFYRPQKNIDEASSASSWHQNVFPLTSSSLQGHGVNEESTHLSSDVTNTHTTIQKISSVKFSVFLRRAVFVSVRGTWCLRCCHVSSRGPTL